MSRLAILVGSVILHLLPVLEAQEEGGCWQLEEATSLLQLHVAGEEAGSVEAAVSLLQRTKRIARASSDEVRKAAPLDGEVKEGYFKANDWLFTASPRSCQEPVWDITQYSRVARVFLPVIFLVLVAFVVLNGVSAQNGDSEVPIFRSSSSSAAAEKIEEEVHRDSEQPQPQRRYDLDIARIVCVCCVVTEHSGGAHWTRHNVAFAIQWALPYLYITSAISWMMSSKGAFAYSSRLSMLLAVGVAANWVADLTTGRDWQHDFGNTVFQMWYVVMLIAMAMATAPLRGALLWRKENPHGQSGHPAVAWRLWVPLVIYGTITLLAFGAFFYHKENKNLIHIEDKSWMSNLTLTINSAPIALIQICGALFLAHLACLFRANDILPWLLVVHIFLPRIFIPWEKVGFLHNLELFVFAMVADAWKLRGQRIFATAVQNYWPIMVFVMMVVSMPDMYGRCDLMPAATCLERARFYGIELTLCLFLTTGAIKVGDPYNITGWLGNWSLYAYCFHVAWARLFPIPYGAVMTYGSIILFYLAGRTSSSSCSDTKEKAQGPDLVAPKTKVPDMAGGG